jgi:hypothetical protein
MDNLKQKKACFVDCGLYVDMARHLSKDFKEMYYYQPYITSGFPTSNPILPGYGYPEIKCIKQLFQTSENDQGYNFNDIDIFIVPFIYFGDIVEHIRSLGKLCWGSAQGDELELNRFLLKDVLRKSNLPVISGRKIKGMTKLKEYLKTVKDKFIKISHYRGLAETTHHINYKLTEPFLTELENDLGSYKEDMMFLVDDKIDAMFEAGIDTYIINGQIPETVMVGIESKDSSYIGRYIEYEKLPKQLKVTHDNIMWYFKEKQYRNFYSNEVRITKTKVPYLIDVTCRLPLPPSELYMEMIDNMAEIIYKGASGEMVSPKWNYKYGALVIIKSDWAKEHFQPILVDKGYEKFLKLRYNCFIDNPTIVPQESELKEIGAVIGVGNTMKEAIENCKENASHVQGYCIEIDTDSLIKNEESVKQYDLIGLKF